MLDGKVSRVQAVDRLWLGRRLRAKRIKVADIVGPAGEYAAEAKRFVEGLLNKGDNVTITVRSKQDRVIIGDVLLAGGQDLAKAIVQAGWAQAGTGASYQLKSLEQSAKNSKLGMWKNGDSVKLAPEASLDSWGAEPGD